MRAEYSQHYLSWRQPMKKILYHGSDQIIIRCINAEIFPKVSGEFRSKRCIYVKSPVLDQYSEPSENGMITIQIQGLQPFQFQFVAVRIAVVFL